MIIRNGCLVPLLALTYMRGRRGILWLSLVTESKSRVKFIMFLVGFTLRVIKQAERQNKTSHAAVKPTETSVSSADLLLFSRRFRFEVQVRTTVEKPLGETELASVFNVTVHGLEKLKNGDVLALTCHVADVTFDRPDVRALQVRNGIALPLFLLPV